MSNRSEQTRSEQIRGVSGATARGSEVLLFVGTGSFGADLRVEHLEKYSIVGGSVSARSMPALPENKKLEAMEEPVVVVLGLSEHADEHVGRIRVTWPHAAIIVAAPETKLADVYPLLVRGAIDFLPLSATPDEVLAKCSLRLGAYRSRGLERSRTLGRLTINLMQRTVTNGNDTASLTPIEVKIVTTLADSLGGVVPRNDMKQRCWGDTAITDNALNRKIYEVRRTLRKLSEDINIRTIYGMGFELSVRGDSAS